VCRSREASHEGDLQSTSSKSRSRSAGSLAGSRSDSEGSARVASARTSALLRTRAAPPAVLRHPSFPTLPSTVPLTYTLTMQACLSDAPAERPTFAQITTIFADLCSEVSRGNYINSVGHIQVRRECVQARRTRGAHACSACVLTAACDAGHFGSTEHAA
jgi:hypothetical protein